MESTSILRSTCLALGIGSGPTPFDPELLLHINSALAILGQNGCGLLQVTVDETTTWDDFKNVSQVKGNQFFNFIPIYVNTKTKILFDPPPPSNVEYYNNYVNELIWRIKIAYEADEPELVIDEPF